MSDRFTLLILVLVMSCAHQDITTSWHILAKRSSCKDVPVVAVSTADTPGGKRNVIFYGQEKLHLIKLTITNINSSIV